MQPHTTLVDKWYADVAEWRKDVADARATYDMWTHDIAADISEFNGTQRRKRPYRLVVQYTGDKRLSIAERRRQCNVEAR